MQHDISSDLICCSDEPHACIFLQMLAPSILIGRRCYSRARIAHCVYLDGRLRCARGAMPARLGSYHICPEPSGLLWPVRTITAFASLPLAAGHQYITYMPSDVMFNKLASEFD